MLQTQLTVHKVVIDIINLAALTIKATTIALGEKAK